MKLLTQLVVEGAALIAGSGGIGDGERPIFLDDGAGDGALDPLNDERREAGRSLGGCMATDGVLVTDAAVGVGGAGNWCEVEAGVATALGTVPGRAEGVATVEGVARNDASWSSRNSLALVMTDSTSLPVVEPLLR